MDEIDGIVDVLFKFILFIVLPALFFRCAWLNYTGDIAQRVKSGETNIRAWANSTINFAFAGGLIPALIIVPTLVAQKYGFAGGAITALLIAGLAVKFAQIRFLKSNAA